MTSGDLNGSDWERGPEGPTLFSPCSSGDSTGGNSQSSLSSGVAAQEQMSRVTPTPLTALINDLLIFQTAESCSYSTPHCNRNVTLLIRGLETRSIG